MSLNRPALAALGTSSFCFVTAETLPVGLLPEIAHDLAVDEATVGLLMTSYAVLAAASAIPLTALTMRLPRHLLIAGAVAVFVLSQGLAAIAPNFLALNGARAASALAHGLFWAVVGPVTARLAAPGQAGRATSLVQLGSSLAIVLGMPLGTALGQWLGWRVAVGVLAGAGALCLVVLLTVLPALPALPRDLATGVKQRLIGSITVLANRRVAGVCLITLLLVIGHFAAYTYFAPLVRRDAGLTGAGLSLLLIGYGAAGLVVNYVAGRHVDRRPGVVMLTGLAAVAGSVALFAPVLGTVPTVLAALVWGGAFTAIPVCLGATILRVAPATRDAASAVLVVAFQVGIGAGAFTGERLVDAGQLGAVPLVAAAFVLVAAGLVAGARQAFPRRLSEADHRRIEDEAAAGAH